MIIDTHSHIYLEQFDEDRDEVVENALSEGVNNILLPNIDNETIIRLHEVEKKYINCFAMMGLHPTSINEKYINQLNEIEKWLFSRSYIGVGEIGIDLYWDKTFIKEQIEAFRQQIIWAKQLNLPIVIHCRDAFKEVFSVIDELHDDKLKGVFHSFSGELDDLLHIQHYQSFKIGINGVVTFKKSNLPDILKHVDPHFLVVETDAPYLSPVPFRGKRNQPAYLNHIINKLVEIYGVEKYSIEKVIYENSIEIFDLKR
ncbi:MAG: TatD family hydrolase [Marinilabiliaceae bacterium]|nr:TatD family hydrolase [Marinilabiliaceae bacterium]